MLFLELLFTAVGLSMDAFAAAICQGLASPKFKLSKAVVVGLFFGGFQALMPLIGWLLGLTFESYITAVDHWIAFALLGFIGGKMIYEAIKKDDDDCQSCKDDGVCEYRLDLKKLTVMAIATSIDALAVGITFALLKVNILPAVLLIGAITFALSFLGVFIGFKFGSKLKDKAELIGGIVLVLIGTKILLEHLGIIML